MVNLNNFIYAPWKFLSDTFSGFIEFTWNMQWLSHDSLAVIYGLFQKIILSRTQKVPKSDSFILDSKTYKQ